MKKPQPATMPKGFPASDVLIACLAPDRRVTVEILPPRR
jgi:hypothetical protein